MSYAIRNDGRGWRSVNVPSDCGPDETFSAVQPSPPGPASQDINAERDSRIASGFSFGGKVYDFDPESKSRVTGAATLAGFAVANGATAGNLVWHGGSEPFAWIAHDNTLVTMDAPTCFAFGQAAAAHETAHIFAARAIKEMTPIPANFKDDEFWP